MLKRSVLLGLLAMAFAAACGGSDEKESEEAGAKQACGAAPAAMAGQPQLPDGFPTPDGVTYTSDKESGPSRIVDGYREGDIDGAYEAYKDAFPAAGYDVTKDEREDVDAEVNFEGGGSTGQVKLIQECADRTSVSITIRPE
jgi:hypothetical protein